MVGYNNSPLNLTVSNFLGIIIISPSSNSKSDFKPGDLIIPLGDAYLFLKPDSVEIIEENVSEKSCLLVPRLP